MTPPSPPTPDPAGPIVGRVRTVLVGPAVPYTRPGSLSGIDKQPVTGAATVAALGLVGDQQGDLRVHGGPDKAVHAYAWAHYAAWRAELPPNALLAQPGAFGENLSIDGADEASVCLGDQWQVGGVLLEVSQGRQPCWKLNDRFGVPDMARRVQDTGRTGWYLRVLRPGRLGVGDALQLRARPHPAWPLARLLAVIRDRVCEPALLRELLALQLTPSWRRLFEQRLAAGGAEDWTRRLQG